MRSESHQLLHGTFMEGVKAAYQILKQAQKESGMGSGNTMKERIRDEKTENQPNNQQPHLLTADSGSTVVYASQYCSLPF